MIRSFQVTLLAVVCLISAYSLAQTSITTYGAKCDARIITDANITSGTATLTSATANFTAADVGKIVGVNFGISGSPNAILSTSIQSVTNSTTAVLANSATRTVAPTSGGGDGWAVIGTDDSSALNSAVAANRWVTIPANVNCVYKQSILIGISNFVMSGFGASSQLIFIPTPPTTTGVNGSPFFIQSNFSRMPPLPARRQIANSISPRATSFVLSKASDGTDLLPNDWLIVGQGDAAAGDFVVSDWVQVQSISGTTVTVKSPFRTAFSVSSSTFDPNGTSGLGVVRIIPSQIVSDIKLRDFGIIVPIVSVTSLDPGIYIYAAKNVEVSGVKLTVGKGQSIDTYQSKALNIHNNTFEGINKVLSMEVASTSDSTFVGNTWTNGGNALDSSQSAAQAFTVDFGSAYDTFSGNTIDMTGNSGIYCAAAYNLTFVGNILGYVKNAGNNPTGFLTQGCQNNYYGGNILNGADASGIAFYFQDSVGYTDTISDANNVVGANVVHNWDTIYGFASSSDSIMDNTRSGGAWRIINGNQMQCTQIGSSCYISTSDLNTDLRFRTNNTNNRLIIQSTGEVVPGIVGNKLGINTLPWDLTVGVTANAAAHFVTSGLTANRNISIPDNSFTLGQVISSGTSSLGTSSISAGACATAVTTSATGTATADTISWAFNAVPGTGYKSGLYILAYVTSGNVNFLVCNPTFSALTPAAATLNWRVIR